MKRILIAVPTAKYIEPETFKSIYDLTIPEGYEVDFQFFYGYQIDQIRNLIASWGVRYDYLFSVDSDIVLPSDTLVKMLGHNKDIVSGVYIQRIPGTQNIEVYGFHPSGATPRLQWEQIRIPGLYQVAGAGFGCVLVNSRVLRSIKYPWFTYHSALDHTQTVSEDVDFCKKARDLGFTIWVDSSIVCKHIGSTTFELTSYTLEQRLEDLGNQRLLPQAHKDYLSKLANSGVTPGVIYDVGACVLHWTREAQDVWGLTTEGPLFYCFEAMEAVEPLYKKTMKQESFIGGFKVGYALSSESEKNVDFYENPWHPGGNSYYKERGDFFSEGNRVKRRTITLDDAAKDFPLPDLIKMDVQGAELDVLKGAEKCLGHATHLILELQHQEYNKGAPLNTEVIEWLKARGWELVSRFCYTDVDGDYHFRKK